MLLWACGCASPLILVSSGRVPRDGSLAHMATLQCLFLDQFSNCWFSSVERAYRKLVVSVFNLLICNLKENLCHSHCKVFSVSVTSCLPRSQGRVSMYTDNILRAWILLCRCHWITSHKTSWPPQKCSDCPLPKEKMISKYSSWWFLSHSQTLTLNLPTEASFLGETAFLFGHPK